MKKDNLDFKLKYYYHKYKDYPLPNADEFRRRFKVVEGKFPYLNELIVMIINYQVKTYGQTLPNPVKIIRKDVRNGKYKKSKKTWYIQEDTIHKRTS